MKQYKVDNIVNFVYYGKTRLWWYICDLFVYWFSNCVVCFCVTIIEISLDQQDIALLHPIYLSYQFLCELHAGWPLN